MSKRLSAMKLVRFNQTSTVNALTQLEARWTKLPEAEQGAIADKLYELQKGDWKKMTLEEKRAGFLMLI
jgi:cytochrome c oxidase subunit 4